MLSIPTLNVLILLLELWLLSALVLGLHRMSERYGLLPLAILMGALTASLQFNLLGQLYIPVAGQTIQVPVDSYVVLPVLLMALLVVYVVNNKIKARNALGGMIVISLLAVMLHISPFAYRLGNGVSARFDGLEITSLSVVVASILALIVDMVVLIVVYQAVSSRSRSTPSRIGAGAALLSALWLDAILFPLIAHLGQPGWWKLIAVNLAGKSLAGLALSPVIVLYLERVARPDPGSAAGLPLPAQDLFTTTLELEARSHNKNSLLQTLRLINQLILRTSSAPVLLEQACQLLANDRSYPLVWIGLLEQDPTRVKPVAKFGEQISFLDELLLTRNVNRSIKLPADLACETGELVYVPDVAGDPGCELWQAAASQHDLRSVAALPMAYNGRIFGVVNIYASQTYAWDAEELELLTGLAGDLAYAMNGLETRSQQLILETAAATMRDGLLITDLSGRIIYANPVLAATLGTEVHELIHKRIYDFLPPEQAEMFGDSFARQLLRKRTMSSEFEMRRFDGRLMVVAVRVALVRDQGTGSAYTVANVHDITHRSRYERQLLTINRLTTDLVQIHDPESLLRTILNAGEELLQADASSIFIYPQEGWKIQRIFCHNMSKEQVLTSVEQFADSNGQSIDRLFTVEAVRPDDPDTYGLQSLFGQDLQALMMTPILYQGKSLGLLGYYYSKPRALSEETRQLARTIAQALAIALNNAGLYQAELSQRRFTEALSRAAVALNSTLELDEVLDLILEQIAHVIPCRSINIMLIRDSRAYTVRNLNLPASDRQDQLLDSSLQLPLNTPTLSRMLETGQPVLVADTNDSPLWVKLDYSAWIGSYVGAPLRVRDDVIGFVNINSEVAGFFDEETVRRLQAFAATAATAVQNARLYQDLQRHTLELEARVQERTAELRTAKERIERILVSVPDAVCVLDAGGHVAQANPTGQRLIERAAAQGIELFSEKFLSHLRSHHPPGEKAILEVEGHSYQALASDLTAQGRSAGMVVVFRDVTRFRELDQMKSKFVSDVSHELRTPLTNLTIYLELLSSTQDIHRQTNYISTLRRETDRLTHLIEDLLTISRLEAGRVSMHVAPLDVNRLVTDLVNDRKSMAVNSGLYLACECRQDLPLAQADHQLLTQILSNLLTNAMNYTLPPGKIRVCTEYELLQGIGWVKISVADTGVGIPSEEIPLIFERFYRGFASQKTNASGTGLGLSISREIVQRMDGWIDVYSELGEGSTFLVYLRAVL